MPTYRLSALIVILLPRPASDYDYDPKEDLVIESWAEITPLRADEKQDASGQYGQATHRMIIRWPGVAINERMEVDHASGRYRIQSVRDPDGSAQYLELIALKETQSAGAESTR